jgi:hypothetical protein
MTQFAVAKEILPQFGRVVGIIGQWFAEVFCASAFRFVLAVPHRNDVPIAAPAC